MESEACQSFTERLNQYSSAGAQTVRRCLSLLAVAPPSKCVSAEKLRFLGIRNVGQNRARIGTVSKSHSADYGYSEPGTVATGVHSAAPVARLESYHGNQNIRLALRFLAEQISEKSNRNSSQLQSTSFEFFQWPIFQTQTIDSDRHSIPDVQSVGSRSGIGN